MPLFAIDLFSKAYLLIKQLRFELSSFLLPLNLFIATSSPIHNLSIVIF